MFQSLVGRVERKAPMTSTKAEIMFQSLVGRVERV